MSKVKTFINNIVNNLKTTLYRFPMTSIFLLGIATIMFIIIEDFSGLDEDLLTRLIFAGIIGALLSTAIKFMVERFDKFKNPLIFYGLTLVLAAGYFFFMTDDQISRSMFIHLLVISFALFAAYLYLPSAKNAVNFGDVALSHFKAAFTSILYGGVLYLGIAAIIGAIDILLYDVDYKSYGHAANIIFILFTPLYYLSLLPKFNSTDEDDRKKKEASYTYPKVLDILVSNITIPLITIFSLVLIIYFIKILVTGVWPVGQVGPMVLGYSAAGYFIYILSSNLNNKIALYYRKVFPLVLIPLVLMQLVSSYIRIDAYGITESRYYVVLFGVFSLVCAVMLLVSKKKNPNTIVLLSALFALISIIPPLDAFSVSRNSQQGRLEEILVRNKMLVNNELVKKSDISNEDKFEITNISNYMQGMGYLDDLAWYPEEYIENYYGNFKNTYGFEQYYYYGNPGDDESLYLNAMLDISEVFDIGGFDKFFKINIYNSDSSVMEAGEFVLNNKTYKIMEETDGKGNLTIFISQDGAKVMEIPMIDFIEGLFETANEPKAMMTQEKLTIEKENAELKIKLIINSLYVDKSNVNKIYISGDAYMFTASPR